MLDVGQDAVEDGHKGLRSGSVALNGRLECQPAGDGGAGEGHQLAHQHVVSDSPDQLLKSRAELENRLRGGDAGLPLVDTVRLLVDIGCPKSRSLDLRADERALRHMHFERRAGIQVPQLAGRQFIAVGVDIDLVDRAPRRKWLPGGRGFPDTGRRHSRIGIMYVRATESLDSASLFSLRMLPCLEFVPCANRRPRRTVRCNAMMLV